MFSEHLSTLDSQSDLTNAFQSLDDNDDGFIPASDLKRSLQQGQGGMSDQEVRC